MHIDQPEKAGSRLALVAGSLGLAWNAYGVVQFVGSISATPDSLMASGLSAEQAAVMTGYPAWMTLAFALGVFGGLFGSGLLIARKRIAVPAFNASLAGYIVLYFGDIVHGVFAAMGPPQIIVLSVVVAIAATLSWSSRRFSKLGLLN